MTKEIDRCWQCTFPRDNAVHTKTPEECAQGWNPPRAQCYNPKEHHQFIEPMNCHSCGQPLPEAMR